MKLFVWDFRGLETSGGETLAFALAECLLEAKEMVAKRFKEDLGYPFDLDLFSKVKPQVFEWEAGFVVFKDGSFLA